MVEHHSDVTYRLRRSGKTKSKFVRNNRMWKQHRTESYISNNSRALATYKDARQVQHQDRAASDSCNLHVADEDAEGHRFHRRHMFQQYAGTWTTTRDRRKQTHNLDRKESEETASINGNMKMDM